MFSTAVAIPQSQADHGLGAHGDAFLEGIAKLLSSHLAGCKSIDLMGNSVGDTGITVLCEVLVREGESAGVLALPALQFLDLRRNKIGRKGALRLADAAAKGDIPLLTLLNLLSLII